MAIESERRFLLDRLPPGEPLSQTTIRQAYFLLGGGWSVRIRREGKAGGDTRNTVTLKSSRRGLSRSEYEIGGTEFTEEDAESLFRAGSEHVVVKTRHSYLIDDEGWDVDEFHWDNDGLIIAELEMEDSEALARRPVPPWAVREVTHDSQYSNDQLAFRPYKKW
jgi:adenylate cyclase